jgi:hypothetical protein
MDRMNRKHRRNRARDDRVPPPAEETPEPFVARCPLDLVALAPQALGFHPEDSVVVLTFGPPGKAFHARVELPTEPADQEAVASLFVGAVLRNALDLAAVLVYSADALTARAQAERLVDELAGNGVRVLDVLRVEGDRYFHLLEDDHEGTPYDLSTHPFTARRVFEGHVVHESRAAVAESLVGTDPAEVEAVAAAAEAEGDRLVDASRRGIVTGRRADALWIQGRVRRFLRTGRPLTTGEAGRMLFLCRDPEMRDVAWAEMQRPDAARHVDFWRDLVRRAPDDLLPAAAALLGFAAWLAGDGALAWCAVDRCTSVAPDYSMADLVAEVLLRAVPPSTWQGLPVGDLPVFGPALDPTVHPTLDPFVSPPGEGRARRAG